MESQSDVLGAFRAEFSRYRRLAEKASAQVSWNGLRIPLDAETNSIAVIMKHVAGNLRSRWTHVFTSDGEKPWRDRDTEFLDDFTDRAALDAWWAAGWNTLEATLTTCGDGDLPRVVLIRGEPHTLTLALARSVSHTAYHCGQIVQLARVMAAREGVSWNTLTIARGGSAAFNAKMGHAGPGPA